MEDNIQDVEFVEEPITVENLDAEVKDSYYNLLLDYVGDMLDLALVFDDNMNIKKEYVYSKTDGTVILNTGHESLNKAFLYARTPRLVKDNEGNICLYIGDTLITRVYK